MLREFVEKKHCIFLNKVDSWQDAIRMSCRPLEIDGTVEKNYAEDIIACVEKHGPYIVLVPMVAMPHSMEGAVGVNGTTISFMKLKEPISFDANDETKDASVFFTLASIDHNAHLENMQKLFEMLTNEELLEEILTVENEEDLLRLDDKYSLSV